MGEGIIKIEITQEGTKLFTGEVTLSDEDPISAIAVPAGALYIEHKECEIWVEKVEPEPENDRASEEIHTD